MLRHLLLDTLLDKHKPDYIDATGKWRDGCSCYPKLANCKRTSSRICLLMIVTQLVLLYGVEVWADALGKESIVSALYKCRKGRVYCWWLSYCLRTGCHGGSRHSMNGNSLGKTIQELGFQPYLRIINSRSFECQVVDRAEPIFSCYGKWVGFVKNFMQTQWSSFWRTLWELDRWRK